MEGGKERGKGKEALDILGFGALQERSSGIGRAEKMNNAFGVAQAAGVDLTQYFEIILSLKVD